MPKVSHELCENPLPLTPSGVRLPNEPREAHKRIFASMNMHELVCPTPPLNQARRQEQTGCQTKGTRTYTPTYAHTKGPLLHETDPTLRVNLLPIRIDSMVSLVTGECLKGSP